MLELCCDVFALGCEAASFCRNAVELRDDPSAAFCSLSIAAGGNWLVEAVLRRLHEFEEPEIGRNWGEVTELDTCEPRLEAELEDAVAILAAVCEDEGRDGGRVGVEVLDVAAGLRDELDCWTSSATGGSARDADDGEDVDEDAAAKGGLAMVEKLNDADVAVLLLRGCGGGLSLQSCPSSGAGTKPPEGLGYRVSAGLGFGGAIVSTDGSPCESVDEDEDK